MASKLQLEKRRYYEKNKEKVIAKSALYYKNNKVKVLARLNKKYKENPVPKIVYAKKYAQANPTRIKKYQKTWKERHPEKRKVYNRNSQIRAFGISPETYYLMLEKQGKRCAICRAESTRKAMSIDHNHTTGKVRGLLCDGCNMSLGHIERKDFLEKALEYLSRYK